MVAPSHPAGTAVRICEVWSIQSGGCSRKRSASLLPANLNPNDRYLLTCHYASPKPDGAGEYIRGRLLDELPTVWLGSAANGWLSIECKRIPTGLLRRYFHH